jgi:hypothetical protein
MFDIRARNSVGNKFVSGIGVGLHNTEAHLQHLYSTGAWFQFAFEEERKRGSRAGLPSWIGYQGWGWLQRIKTEVQGHAGIDHRSRAFGAICLG